MTWKKTQMGINPTIWMGHAVANIGCKACVVYLDAGNVKLKKNLLNLGVDLPIRMGDSPSESKVAARIMSPAERAARRLERREKQRAVNVTRALQMHTSRLSLVAPPKQLNPESDYHVGCSGWFYWHWRESFYPDQLPTKAWFPHYAEHFSTVELNAPFYSWPTVKTVQDWLRQAGNGDFVYTVKVSELITHIKRFRRTKTLVQDFGLIADLLGERMGCFLFQLPPSYHYTPSRLKAIQSQLDPSRRNVVEFRHKSWWNERVYGAFRSTGTIFCSRSVPKLPDELVHTADDVYIRFHGLTKWYRHDYTDEELALWVQRVRDCGCKRVWAYFNNDRDANAIRNAKESARQLQET